jgi:ABC-type dipeptide/oligopeptide/nickel transport systems, permease components
MIQKNTGGLVVLKNLTKTVRMLLKDRRTAIGFILILLIGIISIGAPFFAPNDPLAINMQMKLSGPSVLYPLGTDNLGRCNLSRLIWGARASLTYVLCVLSMMMFLGITIGLISGYIGGKVDHYFMAFTNIFMAFPSVVLALAIAGILGPSIKNLIIAMSCVWWAPYARLIRGMVMEVKEKEFVMVAYSMGCTHGQVLYRHILKNILAPILVLATLEVGGIIISLAAYSFIGLGEQPPTPEWGVMLFDAKKYLQSEPQLFLYPGIAIVLTVLAFNLFGEGLKDVYCKGNR